STMKSRRGFAIQRLMNAMRQAHADGWFIVFDTLTLADDRLEAFYDNPNALRDYFRDIGRMVLAAEGRRSEERFSRNAETDLVCRLLLEKKKEERRQNVTVSRQQIHKYGWDDQRRE